MPSGAKKRKAAKKKKIKEAGNPNSATHSQGDDDLKVHDEKDSDGGEPNSPASQDYHNHQHQFAGGVKEEMDKRGDTPSIRSVVTENEPMVGVDSNGEGPQKVAEEENSVIQIDWVLGPEDDSDSKNVCIEYVESVKEPRGGLMSADGGSSSSSRSSSSDDESNCVQKNVVLIESGELKEDVTILVTESDVSAESVKATDLPEATQATEVVPIRDGYILAVGKSNEEGYGPVAVNAPFVNLVKPTDLPEVTQVADGVTFLEACSLAEKSTDEYIHSVVDTFSLVNSEDAYKERFHPNASSTLENAVCSSVIESGKMENGKDGNSVNSVKPIDLLEVTQVTDDVPVIEAYSLAEKLTEDSAKSAVDTFSLVNSEDASKEGIHLNDGSTVVNVVCSSVFESGKRENAKTESLGVSPVVMDMGPQLVNEGSSTAVENFAVSSVAAAADFVAHEDKGKSLPTFSTPATDTSSSAEHIKDSKITECSDGKPLVDSAPRSVQTTSWMSCCGLFEVFTGSR